MDDQAPKIAVILGTPGVKWKDSGSPFAHIIALRKGEVVAAKARHCIQVFAEDDDGYDTADGVLVVEDRCAEVGSLFEWPVLSAALSMPVKAFEGITNTRRGEPPFLRLKTLSEVNYSANPFPEEDDGYAATVLEVVQHWNEWNRNETPLWERFREIYGGPMWASLSEALRVSRVEAFGKLCRKAGLHFGLDTPLEVPMRELSARLAVARQLFERLTAR